MGTAVAHRASAFAGAEILRIFGVTGIRSHISSRSSSPPVCSWSPFCWSASSGFTPPLPGPSSASDFSPATPGIPWPWIRRAALHLRNRADLVSGAPDFGASRSGRSHFSGRARAAEVVQCVHLPGGAAGRRSQRDFRSIGDIYLVPLMRQYIEPFLKQPWIPLVPRARLRQWLSHSGHHFRDHDLSVYHFISREVFAGSSAGATRGSAGPGRHQMGIHLAGGGASRGWASSVRFSWHSPAPWAKRWRSPWSSVTTPYSHLTALAWLHHRRRHCQRIHRGNRRLYLSSSGRIGTGFVCRTIC